MLQPTLELSRYRGQNRLLLVFAPSASAMSYRQQVRMFANQTAELADRDVLIFYLFEEGPGYNNEMMLAPEVADRLRREFEVEPGEFVTVLIGKDGRVRFRADRPVAPIDIFSLIDILPARQEELRRRGEKGSVE
jgi:hypothetical protein